MINSFKPAKRRNLYEEVADALIGAIERGEYPVGSALPTERELMQLFEVGRPSIREAIAKLGRLGILELKQGARPRVCSPNVSPLMHEVSGAVHLLLAEPKGQQHMREVRLMFEVALARYAAVNIGEDKLKMLSEILSEQAKYLDDRSTWAKLDLEFHKIIGQVPENPILATLQESLSEWFLERSETSLKVKGQSRVALLAHQNIYKALCEKDPQKAEEEMTKHLYQVYDVFKYVFD